MSDAGRRGAERRSDDPHAAGRALLERVRAGELDRPRLVLAARLGSRAARLALGEPPPGACWPELTVEDQPEGLTERVLAAADPEPVVRAALVAVVLGERVLPTARPGLPWAVDPRASAWQRGSFHLLRGEVDGPLEAWLAAALTDQGVDTNPTARLEPLDADGAARELVGVGWSSPFEDLGWAEVLLRTFEVVLPPDELKRGLLARRRTTPLGVVLETRDTFVALPTATLRAGERSWLRRSFHARAERHATWAMGGEATLAQQVAALAVRAEARAARGDAAAAEEDWLRAQALQPEAVGPRWGHGLLRWGQGDLLGAARILEEAAALEQDTKSGKARLERARVLVALGKHAEAIEEADRLLAIAPEPFSLGREDARRAQLEARKAALVVRASARRVAGRPDLALEDAEAAVALGPNDAWPLLERGRIHEARGDVARMRSDAEAALGRAPGMAAALTLRAQARALGGDLPGALEDLRAAVASRPDEPTHREELGRLLLAMGRPEEGQRELDEARRLAPWRFREGEAGADRGGGRRGHGHDPIAPAR